MKTYRHFKVTCLCCGSVWEETSAEPSTVKDMKMDIITCEDCGLDMLDISGLDNGRHNTLWSSAQSTR